MNILDLPLLTVTNTELKEHGYEITAEVSESPDGCLRCGSDELSKYGTKRQVFMDLPMHGKKVGVIVERQRYRCKECNFTFYENLWAMDDRHMCTYRFTEYVEEQAMRRTFTAVADELGVSEGTIRNIFNSHIEHLESMYEPETPRWLGIDEIHIIGKPRGVITNVEDRTILELLPDRNKETIIGYLSNLPNRENVEVVTMDMWKPYKDAVYQTLPNAEVVVDKFHVVRINYPRLRQAYELKEGFYEIWDAETAQEAQERYFAWEASIPNGMKSAFSDIIRAYTNWHHEINNYFTYRLTNAYTESLNSLTRVVNRMGRGYSFKVLRAKMLFSEGIQKTATKNYKKSMQSMAHFHEMYGQPEEHTVYLGADISTLVQRLEEGSL